MWIKALVFKIGQVMCKGEQYYEISFFGCSFRRYFCIYGGG